ncbi:hypothetical protein D1Q00_gp048 [Trichoplusia ni granulovirus LBIV-12]|uniref:Uncharacterized protein n=2 Tax=Betabaculovirus TaxID=558017 RepID=A0A1D8QL73_GVTN|nr:hypothetical protein PsunGV_gp055 [Pseudalatia unipuncta granulovirus]YP_009506118.1 hypothetical protein D1Q00_gp048 [Trichoplusia ni granulovirus LBIV-12]ACH69405.1 unknown [Pseudalatia unipuncta granulovirus]AOW41387.1 hypothetical protein [Trichoplusia ni granulovirus LBIV-12]
MTPAVELNIKLALYQYFIDWCNGECTLLCDMVKSLAIAKNVVVEFEELKTGNYRDVYLIMDNVAAYPDKWNACKQHAQYYVQNKQLHPNCDSLMRARLDGLVSDPQALAKATDDFLYSCCNNAVSVALHYNVYRLAKLIVTGNSTYGSCYYQYVLGYYCTKIIMTKKVSYKLRNLAEKYLSLDMDAFTFYSDTRAADRTNFMQCERNAWKALVDFMKSRNLPESFESQYLRFVLKLIDDKDYDFEGARTHQQRNKLLCCALFGCEREFRNETRYYIDRIVTS